MTGKIELYGFWRSAASYRVRVALALKGLTFTERSVDLMAGEHLDGPFAGLNPQSAVPVLMVDGRAFTQSLAIIEYVEERWPEPPLLPADPALRADVRSFGLIAIADAHPLQVTRVRRRLASQFNAQEADLAAWGAHWQVAALAAMEKRLERRSPPTAFAFSDTPGLADIALAGQVFTAKTLGIDVSAYPRVAEVFGRCLEREAFSRHSPPAMQPAGSN